MRRLLAAALAPALALSLVAAREASAQEQTPRAAYARGVRWLVEHQRPDGAWGSFESSRTGEIWLGTQASHAAFGQATTALAAWALLGPAKQDAGARDAVGRALDQLTRVEPARRVTGDTFYDTWAHTYLVDLAARVVVDDAWAERRAAVRTLLDREVALLLERQSADGGWGYYDFGHSFATPSGHESTSFLTGAALLALDAARQAGVSVDPARIDAALATLRRLRNPDGSYIYGTYLQLYPLHPANKQKGSLGRRLPCDLALVAWAGATPSTPAKGTAPTREELRQGVKVLREHHLFLQIGRSRPYPHEAWYMTAGYYVLFGRYYAARTLAHLGAGEGDEDAAWLAKLTAADQDADGTWMDFPLYGYHQAYGTAFALLTLEAVGAGP